MAGSPLPQLATDELERLRRAVEELSVLNELAWAVSGANNIDEIIGLIVSKATGAVNAQQVVVTMVDSEEMVPDGTMYRETSISESPNFHLTRNLLGCMCHERRALLINDVHNDSRLKGVPLDPTIRNILCVPLLVDSELIAVMSACNKVDGSDFLPEDLRILAIMASQSAQVLDRARLALEDEATAKLKEDLLVATRIQNCLLPSESPEIAGYDVAGISVPARQVGGDYFDFIPVKNNQWGIALGDVSGKGISAALLMANLQAMLRGQLAHETDCGQIMGWCNQQLFLSTPLEKFATLFLGIINTDNHVFTYCNAGHEIPFLFSRSAKTVRLRTGGLAVGMMSQFEYSQTQVSLKKDDVVVIFSDGVTDMANKQNEPFGEDRLGDLLESLKGKSAHEIIQNVRGKIKSFAENQVPFDDLTMVVIKRN